MNLRFIFIQFIVNVNTFNPPTQNKKVGVVSRELLHYCFGPFEIKFDCMEVTQIRSDSIWFVMFSHGGGKNTIQVQFVRCEHSLR